MGLSEPLFSIIVPVYKRADLLRHTLRSVSDQTFKDFELIVVDDASPEDISAVFHEYEGRAHLLRHDENRGQAAARNTGIQRSSGRYIVALDADDLWLPWTLDTFAKAIYEFREPAFGAGTAVAVGIDETNVNTHNGAAKYTVYSDYYVYRSSCADWWFNPSMAFVRRDIVKSFGGYWDSRFYCEDIDFWQRAGTAPGFVKILAPVVCGYRIDPRSATRQSPTVAEGLLKMIDEEEKGNYPGGPLRQRDRIAVIAMHLRHHARELAEGGNLLTAWKLYSRSLCWNLQLRRWKFVMGFPFFATRLAITKHASSRSS